EIGCERRQPIILILRPAIFNGNVLTLDMAGFLQALEERNGDDLVFIVSGLGAEEPDHRHRRLLRPRQQRPRRRGPEPSDERPPLHCITSSAVANSVSGMVRPRVLAVLRLMTNSNLVGCSIGILAGFSPLRMRPV